MEKNSFQEGFVLQVRHYSEFQTIKVKESKFTHSFVPLFSHNFEVEMKVAPIKSSYLKKSES